MSEASENMGSLTGLVDRMARARRERGTRAREARKQRMRAQVLERSGSWTTAGHVPRRGPKRSHAGIVIVGLVGSLAALVIAGVLLFRTPALSFEVASVRPGAPTQALLLAIDEPLVMTFSDGSTIELMPRTRVRVAALREDGADLELSAGTIEGRLEPGAPRSWTVLAGPYRVAITGTAFAITWDPAIERIAIEMHDGQAVVHGPAIAGGRRLAPGERFVFDAHPRPAATG